MQYSHLVYIEYLHKPVEFCDTLVTSKLELSAAKLINTLVPQTDYTFYVQKGPGRNSLIHIRLLGPGPFRTFKNCFFTNL